VADNDIRNEDLFERCKLVDSKVVANTDPASVGFSADAFMSDLNQQTLTIDIPPRADSDSQVPVHLSLDLAASLTGDVLAQERTPFDTIGDTCIDGSVLYTVGDLALSGPELSTVGLPDPSLQPDTVPSAPPTFTWRGDTLDQWWVAGTWAAEGTESFVLTLFPTCTAPAQAEFTIRILDTDTTPLSAPSVMMSGTCDGMQGIWEQP